MFGASLLHLSLNFTKQKQLCNRHFLISSLSIPLVLKLHKVNKSSVSTFPSIISVNAILLGTSLLHFARSNYHRYLHSLVPSLGSILLTRGTAGMVRILRDSRMSPFTGSRPKYLTENWLPTSMPSALACSTCGR